MNDAERLLKRELAILRGPNEYLRNIGWAPYRAQEFILEEPNVHTLVVSTRQFGKTFTFGGLAYYVARRFPGSYSAIVCPDQDKSKKLIEKVHEVSAKDPDRREFEPDNTEEVGIGNGSVIRALPGTIKGVVGGTAKLLVFDEAGLCPRALYDAATPMQAHVDEPWQFVCSSAWWKSGWFWEQWNTGTAYRKVIVRARWDIRDGHIVPAFESEKDFSARMLEEKGAHGFYSDYPTREYMEGELRKHPEWSIRQQYFCEFQEETDAVLDPVAVARAWSNIPARDFKGSTVMRTDIPGRKLA